MLTKIDRGRAGKTNSRFHFALIVFLLPGLITFLSGCNYPGYSKPSAEKIALPPTGTKVRLPDTWTPEPQTSKPASPPPLFSSETQSYTNTPTPTGTPAPSYTLTAEPTAELNYSPTPTIDFLAAPYPNCSFTATKPGVRLQLAPFIDLYRVLPTMEPGKAYTAVVDKPTYSLLLDDGQPAGWVDYRLVALEYEGPDCLSRRDEREITEFPNLCFFSPLSKVISYSDSDLSKESHYLLPENLYILLYQTQDVYFSAFGHAGPSIYISRDEVEIQGDCEDVPFAGQINTETALYSIPDSIEGSVLVPLPVGQIVFIQNKTSPGNPPQNGTSSGNWVQIRIPTNAGGFDGWCWSEFLDYK